MDSNTRMSRLHEAGHASKWVPERGSPLHGLMFEMTHVHLSGAPCAAARKKNYARNRGKVKKEHEFLMVARGLRCETCMLYLDKVYDQYYRRT